MGYTLRSAYGQRKFRQISCSGQGLDPLDLDEEVLKAGSVNVFSIMRDKFLVKIKTSMPSQYPWKTELESFLNEKYCNPELKFDDLMDHFLFCRSYGCKLFKKHLGKTFSEILREIRVSRAQQYLIEEPTLLIYEISDKCGFREQKRLYEAFIRRYMAFRLLSTEEEM